MSRSIIAPRWLAGTHPVAGPAAAGLAVMIDHGAIEAVLPLAQAREQWPDVEPLELSRHLLLPGFVNAHGRITARASGAGPGRIGAPQAPVPEPEAALVRAGPGPAFDAAVLAITAMLAAGITTFVDTGLHPEDSLRAARAFGMRIRVALPVAGHPTAWAGSAGDHLSKGLALHEAWRDDPLASFALHAWDLDTLPDASLAQMASLAAEVGLPVHAGLHADRGAAARSVDRHGRRPLARLEEHGLLGPDFLAAQALHLDRQDLDCLAGHGASVVHCPSQELRDACGLFDAATLEALGVRVALGSGRSDAATACDLIGEARLARLLNRGLLGRQGAHEGRHAVHMLTQAGAEALGMDSLIGAIAVGRRADLVAIELPDPSPPPDDSPLETLLWRAGAADVSHVWIDGRPVVSARQPTDPSAASLSAEVVARSRLWHNRSGEFIG